MKPADAQVLVVDDDARSASLLARMLRTDGYEVEVTVSGAAAIARLTRDPLPAALVTELHLPLADGLAVGRYARARSATMAILFLTAHPDALQHVAEWSGAPPGILTKPLDYALLLRHLAAAAAQDLREHAPLAPGSPPPSTPA